MFLIFENFNIFIIFIKLHFGYHWTRTTFLIIQKKLKIFQINFDDADDHLGIQ